MADLTKFKPRLVTDLPQDMVEFFDNFSGNQLFVTIKGNHVNPLYAPNQSQLEALLRTNELGHDVFFCVNRTEGRRRRKEDIVEVRAVWADDDNKTDAPRTDWPLSPSIIVKTSTGKYHYYWLTSTTNFDEAERVNKGIAGFYNTDSNSVDLARILRVPGTLNHKYETVEKCVLIENNAQVYEWATITAKFPPVSPEKANELSGKSASGKFNETEMRARFVKGSPGLITESGNALIAHWRWHYSKPKTKQRMQELLDTINMADREDEQVERYMKFSAQIDKFLHSIDAKVTAQKAKQKVVSLPQNVLAKPLEEGLELTYVPIPPESIPKVALDAAKAVSDFNSNGLEPAILSILIAVSSMLNKNVIIHEIDDSLTTFCSLGIILAMVSGTRKTQTFKALATGIYEYEEQLQEEWDHGYNTRKAQIHGIEMDIKRLERQAHATNKNDEFICGPKERELKYLQIGKLKDSIDELAIPRPTLVVKDITEEAVIPLMVENKGSLCIMADDSRNVIKNMLGRYSKGDNTSEAWLIDCFGGIRLQSNRVKDKSKDKDTEKPLVVSYPCLNALMFVQPDMAVKLKDSSMYIESGLAARLPIYFYPVDVITMLQNSDRTKKRDDTLLEPYYTVLSQLKISRQDNPLQIHLSDAALESCNRLNNWFVKQLMSVWLGDYDKLNKLVTQSVIYATVFAALDDEDFRLKLSLTDKEDFSYTLSGTHMNMGGMFIKALYEGMQCSTQSLDNTKTINAAVAFSKSLLKHYETGKMYEGFASGSYLYQSFSMLHKDNYQAVLNLLTDRGWLIPEESEVHRELNKGFPRGIVKPGEIIYHLNKDEVVKQLIRADERQREVYAYEHE